MPDVILHAPEDILEVHARVTSHHAGGETNRSLRDAMTYPDQDQGSVQETRQGLVHGVPAPSARCRSGCPTPPTERGQVQEAKSVNSGQEWGPGGV